MRFGSTQNLSSVRFDLLKRQLRRRGFVSSGDAHFWSTKRGAPWGAHENEHVSLQLALTYCFVPSYPPRGVDSRVRQRARCWAVVQRYISKLAVSRHYVA